MHIVLNVKKTFWLLFFLGFCFEGQWVTAQEKKFKILIKIPTRSRPDEFFECLDRYYSYLSGAVECDFLISCDIDDKTMNCPAVIKKLKTYSHLFTYFSPGVSKIEAYNRDIEKHLDFDAVVITSDDLLPVAKNYDVTIRDNMLRYFPDTDGVLQFNDGNLTNNLRTNTYPIIGKKFYDRFGYAYHPFYKSLFCDDEITNVSLLLDKRMVFSDTLFIHVHPAVPLSREYENARHHWDDLYKRNEQGKMYDRDGSIYFQRKAIKFCLNVPTKSVIRLSILVLEECKKKREYFLQQIQKNNLTDCVEVLIDKGGNRALGKRMSDLLQKSHGEYIWCAITERKNDSDLSVLVQKLRTYPDYIKITNDFQNISSEDILRRDVLMKIDFDLAKARSLIEIDDCVALALRKNKCL